MVLFERYELIYYIKLKMLIGVYYTKYIIGTWNISICIKNKFIVNIQKLISK